MKWNSKYFSYAELVASETATRHGLDNSPSAEIANRLADTAERMDHVREILGYPVAVTSGYRGPEVNRLVGGSDSSHHSLGYAVDFRCPKFGDPKAVCQEIASSGVKFDQLIYEGTWVHISFAPQMRKQVLTAVFKTGKKTTYLPGIV